MALAAPAAAQTETSQPATGTVDFSLPAQSGQGSLDRGGLTGLSGLAQLPPGMSEKQLRLVMLLSLDHINYRAIDLAGLIVLDYYRQHPMKDVGNSIFAGRAQGGPASGQPNWGRSIVVGVDWTHFDADGFGYSDVDVNGGMRFTNLRNDKYRLYVQARAGLTHEDVNNVLEILPGVGIDFPKKGKKFSWTAGVDFPIQFFQGDTQTGISFYGGISFPMGGR